MVRDQQKSQRDTPLFPETRRRKRQNDTGEGQIPKRCPETTHRPLQYLPRPHLLVGEGKISSRTYGTTRRRRVLFDSGTGPPSTGSPLCVWMSLVQILMTKVVTTTTHFPRVSHALPRTRPTPVGPSPTVTVKSPPKSYFCATVTPPCS